MAKQDKKVTSPTLFADPGEDIFSRVASLLGNALSTSTEAWKNFGDVEKQAQIKEEYNKIKPLFGKEYRANRDKEKLKLDKKEERKKWFSNLFGRDDESATNTLGAGGYSDVLDEEKDNLLKRLFGNFKLKKLAKVDDKTTSPLYQTPEKDEYNFMQSGDEPVDDTVVDPYSHAASDWAKRFKSTETKTADTKATDTKTDVTKTWADRFVKDDDNEEDTEDTEGTEGKFFKDKGRGLAKGIGGILAAAAMLKNKDALRDAGFSNMDFVRNLVSEYQNKAGTTEDIFAGGDTDITDVVADVADVDKPGKPIDPLAKGMLGFYSDLSNLYPIAGTDEESAYPTDFKW